jgi:hypothetical protein
MTADDTAAAVRTAIACLADADNPAATRVAQALDMWLRGTDFEVSLGLLPRWRSHMRLTSRHRALADLVKMHPDMAQRALADYIIQGVERVQACADGVRPAGADGLLVDLVRAGGSIGERQWRRLIRGHRAC